MLFLDALLFLLTIEARSYVSSLVYSNAISYVSLCVVDEEAYMTTGFTGLSWLFFDLIEGSSRIPGAAPEDFARFSFSSFLVGSGLSFLLFCFFIDS